MEIVDFDQAYSWALETANGKIKKPHLLLGNGFSIAFDHQKFSYTALLENAKKKILELPNASKIFESQNSKDFEKVIEKLETTANVIDTIGLDDSGNSENLLTEANKVKQILAESIADLHADRPFEVSDNEYALCQSFLSNFQKYYTTNYDYLLYWALMQDAQDSSVTLNSNDGFYTRNDDDEFVIWNNLTRTGQNLYYLHGALHLFKDHEDGTIRKITYKRSKDKTALIDQTRSLLRAGTYPLVVAEGSSLSKQKRINESGYLTTAHRSLAALGGSLVCYGISFSENDQHIAKAISDSAASRMAVSVYEDPESDINKNMIDSCNEIINNRNSKIEKNKKRNPIEIVYYDAKTAHIWR